MRPVLRSVFLVVSMLGTAAVTGCSAHATVEAGPRYAGRDHPAYLHALSDLRNARANIERRGGDRAMRWDEHDAIAEIDAAIAEIRNASIDDGKNLDDHPPVDASEPRIGRLHRGLDALRAARHDVEGEEDNGYAGGLRGRAFGHIDRAIRFTVNGIQAFEQGA